MKINRLTDKGTLIRGITFENRMYNKLSPIEDIEEDLEIYLIYAVKALFNPIYYREEKGNFISKEISKLEPADSMIRKIDFKLKGISVFRMNEENKGFVFYDFFFFDEYGKTWALSEEELTK